MTVIPGTPDDDPLNSGFGSSRHHGAVETITYTFRGGQDYFQWAETIGSAAGAKAGTPAARIAPSVGMEPAGRRKASSTYAWEWANNREIGHVATQTFTQQNQGVGTALWLDQ